MESAVLVDSSFFIELLRKERDPAEELLRRAQVLDLATCGLVRLEVVRGLVREKARKRLEAFMDVMLNVVTDNRIWSDATQLAWDLGRDGWTLPTTDILIAASARRIEAAVLTLDKHFDSIPGLTVFHRLDDLY